MFDDEVEASYDDNNYEFPFDSETRSLLGGGRLIIDKVF